MREKGISLSGYRFNLIVLQINQQELITPCALLVCKDTIFFSNKKGE